MKDLSRLLESSDDELALSLLRSAHEEPPPEALGKVAAALGVGGALGLSGASGGALLASHAHAAIVPHGAAAVAPAASASSPWLLAAIAKPLAVGLVGSAVALGGINYATAPASSSPTAQSVQASRATAVAKAPVRASRATPISDQQEAPTLEAEPAEPKMEAPVPRDVAAAPRVHARRPEGSTAVLPAAEPPRAPIAAPSPPAAANPPAPPSAEPVQAVDEALAKELSVLAQARAALGASDASSALRLLDQYFAERHGGALEPEASMLRIRALQRLGDRQRAAQLARSFLKAHPERSHDALLQSIAAEAR